MSYILIAEDNPDAAHIFERLIDKRLGVATKIAPNGRDALLMANADVPALILLDLMMPHVNGFQVLAKLWSNPRTHEVPVIVVSGISNLTHVAQLPNVHRVMQKAGFSLTEIQAAITEVLESTGQHQLMR